MTEVVSYSEHLQSETWMRLRQQALNRSRRGPLRQPTCEVCGVTGTQHKTRRSDLDWPERQYRVDGSNGLQVHHITYERLGHERPEDLIVLCTNALGSTSQRWEGCHERAHRSPLFRAVAARVAQEREEGR